MHAVPDEDPSDPSPHHGDEPASAPFDAAMADGFDGARQPDGADLPNGEWSYWSLSRTPLTSLVFTLPLVIAYEGGVLMLGRGTPRNGADVWLRQALDAAGFGSYFLLPAITILGLLAWHHVEHDRWRFRPAVLVGMAIECLVLAALLIGLARLQDRLWPLDVAIGQRGIVARVIGFCGAGLYEEVLFRLLMLPAAAWLLGRLSGSGQPAWAMGVVVSSLLFAAAHYVGPLGDTFAVYSFTFRFLAGVFFAVLLLIRGFGIAAGTHAAYDLLVGVL